MHRWLIVLVTVVAGLVAAPRAWAGDAPIGHLGDTLRVDTGKVIADVTVTSVQPVDTPPAFGYQRADVFPKGFPGSTIVYWDTYRDPVSNVVLLDKKTGMHLAQWNL